MTRPRHRSAENRPFINVIAPVWAFLNQHLTVISLTAILLSIIVFAAGPVRLWLQAADGVSTVVIGNDVDTRPGAGEVSFYQSAMIERLFTPFTIIPDRPRREVISYTIQPGDTLEGIANAFGLRRESIFWANTDVLRGDVHLLLPDTVVAILPEDGILHMSDATLTVQQIADEHSVSAESIITSPYNEIDGYKPDMVPPWGMRLVATGGVGEFADWRAPIVEVVDPTSGVASTAFMPGMGGSCGASITGSGGSGAWTLPLSSGTYAVTQGFSSYHSGIDMAAVAGSPVYASDTGVVIFSGWVTADWGYGILVVLDHGNGWTSYYAHMASTSVRCGQVVQRGTPVGTVGSTGNSSGPHLHFELRWGHVPDNPAAYLGF